MSGRLPGTLTVIYKGVRYVCTMLSFLVFSPSFFSLTESNAMGVGRHKL